MRSQPQAPAPPQRRPTNRLRGASKFVFGPCWDTDHQVSAPPPPPAPPRRATPTSPPPPVGLQEHLERSGAREAELQSAVSKAEQQQQQLELAAAQREEAAAHAQDALQRLQRLTAALEPALEAQSAPLARLCGEFGVEHAAFAAAAAAPAGEGQGGDEGGLGAWQSIRAGLDREVQRLGRIREHEERLAELLRGCPDLSTAQTHLRALGPLVAECGALAAGLAQGAADETAAGVGAGEDDAEAGDDDAAAVVDRARECARRLRDLRQRGCRRCEGLRGLVATWGPRCCAEEARQRAGLTEAFEDLQRALGQCWGWVQEAGRLQRRQAQLEELLRQWEDRERQQRRGIAAQEVEARNKLLATHQKMLRWHASATAKAPERKRPTVAWIGIEISEGRVLDGRLVEPETVVIDGAELPGVKVVAAKGPAAKQGVQVGDVITHLNDRPTTSLTSFKCLASKVKPGQTVSLTLGRAGVRVSLDVLTSEVQPSPAPTLHQTRH